jgi:hypothetical protein
MKKKIRINGRLPGEEEVVLGYVDCNNYIEAVVLMNEYKEVYGDIISFRCREVTMLPYEKGVAIVNLLCALTGQPKNNFNSMFDKSNIKEHEQHKRFSTAN